MKLKLRGATYSYHRANNANYVLFEKLGQSLSHLFMKESGTP